MRVVRCAGAAEKEAGGEEALTWCRVTLCSQSKEAIGYAVRTPVLRALGSGEVVCRGGPGRGQTQLRVVNGPVLPAIPV